MKRKSIMLLITLFVISAFIYAQNAPKGPNRGIMGKLNLTDEQKAKVESFRLDFQKRQIAVRSKIQTARIELQQILSSDKLDKSAIEKKLNEISKLEVEQKMNFINHWEQINQILTPEQKTIWKNTLKFFDSPMKKNMLKKGMRDRRDFRGPGKPQGALEEPGFLNDDIALTFNPFFTDFEDEEFIPENPPFDEFDNYEQNENDL